jgi:hypothetical protein
MEVEQSRVRTDGDLCLKRREAEGDVILRREGGLDVNQACERREPDARDLNSIPPKCQAFRDERPFGARLQILSKLVAFTDQLHGTLDRQTGGVGHREA